MLLGNALLNLTGPLGIIFLGQTFFKNILVKFLGKIGMRERCISRSRVNLTGISGHLINPQ